MPLYTLFRKNLTYFIPVFILLLTGIIFWFLYPKDTIHIVQNAWHSPFFDHLFVYGTFLGDGLIFLPVALVLAFVKWRYFAGLVMAATLTLLITGILKQVVFEDALRPAKYFEDKHELRLVEGVKMHHYHSFPSGHTTTAFACFGFLAFIIRANFGKFLCFVAAAVAGYSRIYLSQHFMEDVLAGAIAGTTIAVLSYYLMLWIKWKVMNDRLSLKKRPL